MNIRLKQKTMELRQIITYKMVIAIDFDGTCVTHEFPKVGRDIGAIPVLKELIANGHQLILYTMRSDIEDPQAKHDSEIHPVGGNYLTDAINWFKDNGIELYSVQINPTQSSWTHSNKCYAELYIDDAALGCPLVYNKHKKPYVDWVEVRRILVERGIIKQVIVNGDI